MKQSVCTQYFIKSKNLHVSAVGFSHHHASRVRNVKGNCIVLAVHITVKTYGRDLALA